MALSYHVVLSFFLVFTFADVVLLSVRAVVSRRYHTLTLFYALMGVQEALLVFEFAAVIGQLLSTYLLTAGMWCHIAGVLGGFVPLWVLRVFFAAFAMIYKDILTPQWATPASSPLPATGAAWQLYNPSSRAWRSSGYGAVLVLEVACCCLYYLNAVYVLGYASDKTLYVPYHRRRWRHLQWERALAATAATAVADRQSRAAAHRQRASAKRRREESHAGARGGGGSAAEGGAVADYPTVMSLARTSSFQQWRQLQQRRMDEEELQRQLGIAPQHTPHPQQQQLRPVFTSSVSLPPDNEPQRALQNFSGEDERHGNAPRGGFVSLHAREYGVGKAVARTGVTEVPWSAIGMVPPPNIIPSSSTHAITRGGSDNDVNTLTSLTAMAAPDCATQRPSLLRVQPPGAAATVSSKPVRGNSQPHAGRPSTQAAPAAATTRNAKAATGLTSGAGSPKDPRFVSVLGALPPLQLQRRFSLSNADGEEKQLHQYATALVEHGFASVSSPNFKPGQEAPPAAPPSAHPQQAQRTRAHPQRSDGEEGAADSGSSSDGGAGAAAAASPTGRKTAVYVPSSIARGRASKGERRHGGDAPEGNASVDADDDDSNAADAAAASEHGADANPFLWSTETAGGSAPAVRRQRGSVSMRSSATHRPFSDKASPPPSVSSSSVPSANSGSGDGDAQAVSRSSPQTSPAPPQPTRSSTAPSASPLPRLPPPPPLSVFHIDRATGNVVASQRPRT